MKTEGFNIGTQNASVIVNQSNCKWIKIIDSVPINEGYYLTWVEGFSRPIELYYSNGCFRTTDRHSVNVTHWMPLPNPPIS